MLRGDLTGASQSDLKQKMQAVLADGSIRAIKLDFSGVTSIESTSTGTLMLLSHTAKAKSKTLGIVNASPQVLSAMNKANLGKIIPIQGL